MRAEEENAGWEEEEEDRGEEALAVEDSRLRPLLEDALVRTPERFDCASALAARPAAISTADDVVGDVMDSGGRCAADEEAEESSPIAERVPAEARSSITRLEASDSLAPVSNDEEGGEEDNEGDVGDDAGDIDVEGEGCIAHHSALLHACVSPSLAALTTAHTDPTPRTVRRRGQRS